MVEYCLDTGHIIDLTHYIVPFHPIVGEWVGGGGGYMHSCDNLQVSRRMSRKLIVPS